MSVDRMTPWFPKNVVLVCIGSMGIGLLLVFGAVALATGIGASLHVVAVEPTPLTREYIETATLLIVVGVIAEVAAFLTYRSVRRWWKNKIQFVR